MALRVPEIGIAKSQRDTVVSPAVQASNTTSKSFLQKVLAVVSRRKEQGVSDSVESAFVKVADSVGSMRGVEKIVLIPLGSVGRRLSVVYDDSDKTGLEDLKEVKTKIDKMVDELGKPVNLRSIIYEPASTFVDKLQTIYNVDLKDLDQLWPREELSSKA